VQITDDGPEAPRLPATDDHTPRGLLGMRERVGLYGGTLSTGHSPGRGFTVSATFPLPEQVR
jgi:signal transduction histidine kinase